jgi:hypothetical protein
MSLPPICTSTTCEFYKNQRFTEVYINYNNVVRYQYNRLVPDYFRRYFPECGFANYREALNDTTSEISACLRSQLSSGAIDLYSLEELFIRIVPSINDTPEEKIFKDNIRNEYIAFALNIEKSYLYFNKGRQTCNNNFVPWDAVFSISIVNSNTFTYTYAKNVPITQYDQYIIYNLSMNYFDSIFSARNTNSINYFNIIRLALGLPIVGNLTIVNFYNLIYFAFVFLNQLFTISQTLLLGKDPGIPKQFLNLFFPPDRQRYYYNFIYHGYNPEINIWDLEIVLILVMGMEPILKCLEYLLLTKYFFYSMEYLIMYQFVIVH